MHATPKLFALFSTTGSSSKSSRCRAKLQKTRRNVIHPAALRARNVFFPCFLLLHNFRSAQNKMMQVSSESVYRVCFDFGCRYGGVGFDSAREGMLFARRSGRCLADIPEEAPGGLPAILGATLANGAGGMNSHQNGVRVGDGFEEVEVVCAYSELSTRAPFWIASFPLISTEPSRLPGIAAQTTSTTFRPS